jgi:hypothetical protein
MLPKLAYHLSTAVVLLNRNISNGTTSETRIMPGFVRCVCPSLVRILCSHDRKIPSAKRSCNFNKCLANELGSGHAGEDKALEVHQQCYRILHRGISFWCHQYKLLYLYEICCSSTNSLITRISISDNQITLVFHCSSGQDIHKPLLGFQTGWRASRSLYRNLSRSS